MGKYRRKHVRKYVSYIRSCSDSSSSCSCDDCYYGSYSCSDSCSDSYDSSCSSECYDGPYCGPPCGPPCYPPFYGQLNGPIPPIGRYPPPGYFDPGRFQGHIDPFFAPGPFNIAPVPQPFINQNVNNTLPNNAGGPNVIIY